MKEFSILNERIKDSIHAFLEDTPNNLINEFDLKIFKSICADCARRDCTVRHTLPNAGMISSCKYFTRTTATSDIKAVGGTIFYIDDKADGKYEFFDVDGNLIENVQIGDRPSYYRVVKKGPADKYYVYHDKVYDALGWTYRRDGKYVYESLNTSDDIRSGKTNTEVIMAKDSGAYITADSKGFPTIWYQLWQTRLAKAGGCDDWFIPSKNEIELLRIAIESGTISGGTIAGSSYEESVFRNRWFWSSSEASSTVGKVSSQYAWYWDHIRQLWNVNNKICNNSVFFVRAF